MLRDFPAPGCGQAASRRRVRQYGSRALVAHELAQHELQLLALPALIVPSLGATGRSPRQPSACERGDLWTAMIWEHHRAPESLEWSTASHLASWPRWEVDPADAHGVATAQRDRYLAVVRQALDLHFRVTAERSNKSGQIWATLTGPRHASEWLERAQALDPLDPALVPILVYLQWFAGAAGFEDETFACRSSLPWRNVPEVPASDHEGAVGVGPHDGRRRRRGPPELGHFPPPAPRRVSCARSGETPSHLLHSACRVQVLSS